MKEPWPKTDPQKAGRLAAGDHSAWSWLARTYSQIIYRTLRGAGLKHQQAEDVAQEVLLKMRRARYEGRGRFRWFLLVTIRNACRDYRDKNGRQPQGVGGTSIMEFLDDVPQQGAVNPADQLVQEYEKQLYELAMKQVQPQFSEQHWQAFWMTFVESRKSENVADSLGLNAGNVRQIKMRILNRIKQRVAELERDMEADFRADD